MVPLLKAPMSTPDKARDDRVPSFEGGVSLASMVTVAEPTDCPPWGRCHGYRLAALKDDVVGGGDGGRGRACARPHQPVFRRLCYDIW